MAWIKFDIATSEKPEVWQMATQLALDPDAVVGKLLRVWAWFDEHTTDGNAPSVTKALLNSKLSVSGFCECMIAVGWMIESEGQISLPNFDRHNGTTAKNRALTAQRVGSHKERKQRVTQNFEKSNAQSVTTALPREEKIREDKNNLNTPPNPQGGKRERKKKVDFIPAPPFDEFDMPTSHKCEVLRNAWNEWIAYRGSRGMEVSKISGVKSINALSRMAVNEAVASINRSIARNWENIIPCPRNEVYLYFQSPNDDEIRF